MIHNNQFQLSADFCVKPLILILTHRCNLNCKYCHFFKKNDFIKKEFAFKAIELYLDSLNGAPGKIKIFGGEPLLEVDLLKEVVRYIREESYSTEISLVTNGVLLNSNVLNWFKINRVRVSLSIDGAEDTQLLNRRGTIAKDYKKITQLIRQYDSSIIIYMVISPNTVDKCFTNFFYMYNLGIRKFNFLPAGYITWPHLKSRLLDNQLSLVASFINSHRDIYVKNVDTNNELFLYNLGIVVDCNGDIFPSDIVISKDFRPFRNKVRIDNISECISFSRLNFKEAKEKVIRLIQRHINPEILTWNKILDRKTDNFVERIKSEKAKRFKRLDIKIGYNCNNSCLFCIQGDKRKGCSFRQNSQIKNDLIHTRKFCDSVVFTGGEPTLHPEFLDLVSFAKNLDFKVIQIQSNGRMFAYRKFCEEVVNAGANEFALALHGHTDKIHDFLTRSAGSFQQTISGISNLKKLNQQVMVNTVITTKNYEFLPHIARLLISLDVNQFQFAFIHIGGTANKNRHWIVPRKTQVMPYVKKGLDMGLKAGRVVMTEAIPYCFMKDYEQCVAEQFIPRAMVIENKFKIKDYEQYRINRGKDKGPLCYRCIYFSICEGPWKEYPRLFGWSEFKPVLDTHA